MFDRSQAAGDRAEADRPLVILVDDDDGLREALHEIVRNEEQERSECEGHARDQREDAAMREGGGELAADEEERRFQGPDDLKVARPFLGAKSGMAGRGSCRITRWLGPSINVDKKSKTAPRHYLSLP